MKIYFLNGEMSGIKVKLEPVTKIGRDEDNNLPISGLGISRHHATFILENDIWKILDGGSTNGVRVNHEKIDKEKKLTEGDIIELGNQTIRFGEVRDISSNDANATNIDTAPTVKPGKTVHLDKSPTDKNSKIIFHPQQDGNKADKSNLKIKGADSGKKKSLKKTAKLPPSKPDTVEKQTGKKRPTEAVASRELSDALKNGKIALFKPADQQAKPSDANPEKIAKRKFSNLLFYVTVACVAVVIIVLFIKIQENSQRAPVTAKPTKKLPKLFLLVYEKTKLSPDNIFRFFMKVENKQAYFSIDDLKSQRSYEKTVTLTQEQLDKLQLEIEQTEIMEVSAPPPGSATNELDETKRLLISYNGQIKEVKIINNAMPVSFSKVTDAISDFVGNYGLQTISMTPDELKEKAEEMFNKAEILFHNRTGHPANLRKAVLRYNMAEEFLSQFSPKPPMWSKAKKQAAIAESIRKTRLKELSRDEMKFKKLGEYEKRDEILTEMMQLCLPESKVYLAIRKEKIKNDEKLRSINKR